MSIKEKVLELVKENSEKKINITPDCDLKEDAGIDSFEYLMIINALEDEFHVQIDETKYQHLRTVTQITEELVKNYPVIGKN